jgi:Winged helix DNA-binding domain
MPVNGRFRLPRGEIEVATRFGLRAAIPRALRRHGWLTSQQLANLLYWGRSPRNDRLAAKWWANQSQQSATRRAIARLKRDGAVRVAGRRGRWVLYAVDYRGPR